VVDLGTPRGWLPRLLAPIAFFAAATVLILLVQNALSSDDGPTSPTTTQSTPPTTTDGGNEPDTSETGTGEQRRRYYRVRSGDLLETIAAEFNTSVERLLELNPGIDPQALTVGERIRVR
jgi:LysM repeat protein